MDIKLMRLTLGQKFKMLREQSGKSEVELAEYMKMSLSTYQKTEQDFLYPKDDQIAKLGRFYDLTYEEVLEVGEDV
jgi:transcriptional regulator with XRE-family HTH domain